VQQLGRTRDVAGAHDGAEEIDLAVAQFHINNELISNYLALLNMK
jgi:hypothetical protein